MRLPLRHRPLLALTICLVFTLTSPLLCLAEAQQSQIPLGMVSLKATRRSHDATIPWYTESERQVRGNALVVSGELLLTTADMIKDATLIEVRKLGRYPDYQATPVLVDRELDLALLKVVDTRFWAGLSPIPLSRDPVTSSRFLISRWRPNGRFEQASGEISDVRTSISRFGTMELPQLRGTTNMSGLGWAEVMSMEGKVIGIVTAHGDNQIQAALAPLLIQFVEAAALPAYEGFAHRGFSWQRLNQSALRRYHGLAPDDPGVLVTKPLSGGTGAEELRPGDILMRLGNHEIDPEGMISHPLYGAMRFPLSINDTLGPTIAAEVLRDGERQTLSLSRHRFTAQDYRIPTYQDLPEVDFEVFGGLVIQELTLSYLRAWGNDWRQRAPTRLVIEYALRAIREADQTPERVLIVSTVLPDAVNLGYQNLGHAILTHANGRKLDSLPAFRQAIQYPEGAYHIIEMLAGQGRRRLVFADAEIAASNHRITKRYAVPSPPGSLPLSVR